MYGIGLDIGGTKCAMTLGKITDSIEILERVEIKTSSLTPAEALNVFSEFIQKRLSYGIGGIGISCGGPLDSKNGIIMSPPSLPLWDNIHIVDYFQNKFNIPTYLQNDANACAFAEWKFGAGRGCNNMIFITCGTGFGAGLILNGKLYSGTNDNAGEIGHVRLTTGGPYGYYKYGSVEGYCSGGGIARLALIMEKTTRYRESAAELFSLYERKEDVTTKDIANLAKKGNKFCLSVFKKSGTMLGKSLSILVDILNPEKIVIGGVFMRAEELLLPHARKVMEKECLGYSLSAVQVVPAELDEHIGDYASLGMAISASFTCEK